MSDWVPDMSNPQDRAKANALSDEAERLLRSGKYKKVRINGNEIEVKPRPPEEQQFRPV